MTKAHFSLLWSHQFRPFCISGLHTQYMCMCVCVFLFSLHTYFLILENCLKYTKYMVSDSPRLEQQTMLINQTLQLCYLKSRKPWLPQKLSRQYFPFWASLCPTLRIFLFLWFLVKSAYCLLTVYCDKITHPWNSEITPNFADPCATDWH